MREALHFSFVLAIRNVAWKQVLNIQGGHFPQLYEHFLFAETW